MHSKRALILTLIYTIIGLLWISVSDWFLNQLARDADTLTRLQNYKGWLFIFVTSAVVWFLTSRALARQSELNAQVVRSESRLRSIYENVNDGILIYDLERQRIADSNPKLQRMFGCSRDDVRTLSIRDLSCDTPPENADNAERRMASARKGTPSMFEWHVRRPDGSEFWAEVTIRYTVMNGRDYSLMVVRNVSERREALSRLRLSAEVFENARDGIVITDASPSIIDANPAFCEITGYPREELVGRDPGTLRTDADVPREELELWQTLLAKGHWQGEIVIRSADGTERAQILTVSAVGRNPDGPEYYVGVYTDITDLKASQKRLEDLAYYDPLTHLPNRLLFHSRVDTALRRAAESGEHVAIIYMDLDNFKNVNDSFGHPMGDNLLVEITQRMRAYLPGNALLAHLAGDEFVILLTGLEQMEAAEQLTRKLLGDLERPFELSGGSAIYISACAGISVFNHSGETAMDLIQYAHAALYQAKKHGRRSIQFFTPGLIDEANARIRLESRLHGALKNDEFVLHFQPLMSGAGGDRVFGLEALCRWQPPGEELVPPDRFIPLAEESGLIIPLGKWVLESACRQLRAWHEAGHAGLVMAVNLSVRQFNTDDIVEIVRTALEENGLDGSCLQLELTESLMMEYSENMLAKLDALSELGLHLVLDDFGTGYSCLSYLHRMPLDLIKIDRSFVQGMQSGNAGQELVTAMISMAHCINMDVLAEGIETREQLEILAAMGCRRFQGFYFGRPLPADETTRALAEQWPAPAVITPDY